MPDTGTTSEIERLLRNAAPDALGVLLRRGEPFADAEDAVQDAVLVALDSWSTRGVPDRPVGWVIRVAQRRLIDQHHRDTARRRREALVASWSTLPGEPEVSEDDSLALLFLCCHGSLTAEFTHPYGDSVEVLAIAGEPPSQPQIEVANSLEPGGPDTCARNTG